MAIAPLERSALLPAPADLRIFAAEFICMVGTGTICDPTSCDFCGEQVCAEEEHWFMPTDEPYWCVSAGVSVIVHRSCHAACRQPECDPEL